MISGKDLSQNDTIFNKSGYSSPEQLNTGKCYKNSDIYSLGVTSLVLLTGKEPSLLFDSFEQEKIWHQYVNISEEFKDILDKMLAEDYKKRYNSAKEVLRELNKIDLSKKAQKNTAPTVNKLSIKHKFISQKTTFSLNKNLSFKINLKSQSIFLFSLLTILGLGGAIFVIKSPDITAICKTFNNCSKDTRYKEKFFQIVKKGDDILTNFNQVQNLDELIYHHERLKTIVTNLKKIPTDVKIFPQAQLQLKEYNQNLDEFKAKIDYEKAAEIKLNLILEEFDNLKTETEEANTINSYEIVKSEWVNLQGSLENFEQDLLIGATILAKIIESETQIKYINNQITLLLAEENGQELDAIAIKPKKETPDKINKEQPINKTQENNYTIDYVDLALVLTTLLLMYLIRL